MLVADGLEAIAMPLCRLVTGQRLELFVLPPVQGLAVQTENHIQRLHEAAYLDLC